jgi:hypothetical protein
MSSAYRIEAEPTGGSGVQQAPLAVPPPWWRRRGVQLGAGLLGAGLILGLVLGRRGSGSDASARTAPRPARELEQIVPHAPVTREAPPAPAVVAPRVVAPAPPPTVIAPTSPTNAPVPPPPANASIEAAAAPVRDPAAAPPVPARRDVARVVAKPRPRPTRPAAAEGEGPRPAPAPRVPRAAGARPPFSTEQFDDASNTSGAPAAGETVKAKKAPIAPDFDN